MADKRFKVGLPAIVSKLPNDIRNYLDRIREFVDTSQGLGAAGQLGQFVRRSELASTNVISVDQNGNIVNPNPANNDFTPPPAPVNLVATGAITTIMLSWDDPHYSNFSTAEIWRAQVDDLGVATKVGNSLGNFYSDSVDAGTTHYYWVRFVSKNSVDGPFNSTNGTAGTTSSSPTAILGILAGQITTSQLQTALNTRINLIDDPLTVTGSVNERLDTLNTGIQVQISSMGVGATGSFDAGNIWYFDTSVDGFTTTGGTQALNAGWVEVTSTGIDPSFVSPVIAIDGGAYPVIKARVKRLAGTGWDGTIFYSTAGHGMSGLYCKTISMPANFNTVNDTEILEWDMSVLTAGGNDFITNTITQIRIDIGNTGSDVVSFDWVAVGRNAPGASVASVNNEIAARTSGDAAQATATSNLSASLSKAQTSLLPNWDLTIAINDAGTMRPAGLEAVEGIDSRAYLTYLDAPTNTQAKIVRPASNVAYGFPAIPVDENLTYTIEIRHKSSAASATGLYLRMNEKNSALATGKTHIGLAVWTYADARTSVKDMVSNGPMPGTAWVTNTYTYKPTAGVKFASFSMYNWVGGTAEYHVDYVKITVAQNDTLATINSDYMTAASTTSAIASQTATLSATVGGHTSSIQTIQTVQATQSYNILTPNPFTQWTLGTGAFPTGWTKNGAVSTENQVVDGVGPFGTIERLLYCAGDGSNNADGGWNSTGFIVDNTKTYRFIVFIKRNALGMGNGNVYLGCYVTDAAGGTSGPMTSGSGLTDTNPYFISMSAVTIAAAGIAADEWFMCVGYLHALGTPLTATILSGVYKVSTGQRILTGNADYIFRDALQVKIVHRSYAYYSTVAGTVQTFARPRLDICDGTEQSIQSILADSSIAQLRAEYTIKTDVNGYVAGFGLANGGASGNEFIANVDKFAVTSPDTSVPLWTATTAYAVGKCVRQAATAGKMLVCKIAGTSGGGAPSMAGAIGTLVTDGSVTWQIASRVPFSVLSISQTINGYSAQPGVYIDGAVIVNGTVQNAQIANLAVDSAKIANLAVDATKIANATITDAKIAAATITAASIAAATITGAKIASATITAANIASATITAANIATATITGAKIAAATIATANIANAQITTALIADAQITNAKIADLSVDTIKIANQAVTIPVSAYYADILTLAGAYQDIVSATFNSSGAPMTLTFNTTWEATMAAGAQALIRLGIDRIGVGSLSSGALSADRDWREIAHDGTVFCTVAYGTNIVAVSSDNVNWVEYATLPSSGNWCVITGGGGYLITAKYGSTAGAYSLDHGLTWTSTTLPYAGNWTCSCHSPDTGYVGYAGANSYWFFATGISNCYYFRGGSWATVALGTTASWSVCCARQSVLGQPAVFVAASGSATMKEILHTGSVLYLYTLTLPAALSWSAMACGYNSGMIVASGSATAYRWTGAGAIASFPTIALGSAISWSVVLPVGYQTGTFFTFLVLASNSTVAATIPEGTSTVTAQTAPAAKPWKYGAFDKLFVYSKTKAVAIATGIKDDILIPMNWPNTTTTIFQADVANSNSGTVPGRFPISKSLMDVAGAGTLTYKAYARFSYISGSANTVNRISESILTILEVKK